jgi:TolB protein
LSSEEQGSQLTRAIQAARAGNRTEARRLLEKLLERDDGNEQAWMVLASVVETPRERRICLENALEINPNNSRAREALGALEQQRGASSGSVASAAGDKPAAPRAEQRVQVPTKRAGVTTPGAQDAWSTQRVGGRINSTFLVAAILSVMLIVVGFLLITGTLGNGQATATVSALAVSGTPGIVVDSGTATQSPTPMQLGTLVQREFNPQAVAPSWTPSDTPPPPPSLTPTPTVPPLADYSLVFASERADRPLAVFSANAGGGAERLLIPSDAPVTDPAFSPDGRRLAYVTEVNGRWQLAVSDADGTNATIITEFAGTGLEIRGPAWSPDNERIAFFSNDGGWEQIWLIDADGANLTLPWESGTAEIEPAWSPDGTQLVYAADVTGRRNFQIFVRSLDPVGEPVQLTTSGQNFSPAWSPDGRSIAFISTRTRQQSKVYIMRADGSDERILTFDDGSAENADPMWSPDGAYLAFASNRNGGIFNLYMMRPDGSGLAQITNGTNNATSPRFRPLQ